MYKLKTYLYIRKDKTDNHNKAPVYLRITEDGSRIEISLKVKVDVDQWNQASQRATGKKNSVNQRIEDALSRINTIERKYIDREKPTLDQIKNEFLGKPKEKKFYLEEWDKLIQEIENSLGKQYSEGTFKKYKTTRKHFANFLKYSFKKNDIEFKDLSIDLINNYFFYLRSHLDFKHNTVVRYIKNTKVVLNRAIKRGWINFDPFVELDLTYERTERVCLNKDELKKIQSKEITIARLDRIRDYFVFSCYTGLSFSDIEALRKGHLKIVKGKVVLQINRQKTNIPSYIPLLNPASQILSKYGAEELSDDEVIFDIPSNQKYNAYLKELADICDIEKKLTTHVARHTFATTVTLEQGVSIESVSNMLGHSQLRTTQIYSKVTEEKVLNEMMDIS